MSFPIRQFWGIGVCSGLVWCVLVLPAGAQKTPRKPSSTLQEVERLQQELDSTRRQLEALRQQRADSSLAAPAMDFYLAGLAYVSLQKYPEAVAAFSRALVLEPQEALVLRHRGIAYVYQNDTERALADLSRAIELDGQDAVAYNYRGIVYFALENLPQALSNFDKALELQPHLAEALNNRGLAYRHLGDYQHAAQDFAAAAQAGIEEATQHMHTLRQDVRQLQERLQAAGVHSSAADGLFGQPTLTALRQYQKRQKLLDTGLLDQATRRALGLLPAPEAPSGLSPRFVHHPAPEYPPSARVAGAEGTVILHLELLDNGAVGQVEVAQSSGHAMLDTAAREAVQAWRHTPVLRDGKAITAWTDLTLTFVLDKGAGAGQ